MRHDARGREKDTRKANRGRLDTKGGQNSKDKGNIAKERTQIRSHEMRSEENDIGKVIVGRRDGRSRSKKEREERTFEEEVREGRTQSRTVEEVREGRKDTRKEGYMKGHREGRGGGRTRGGTGEGLGAWRHSNPTKIHDGNAEGKLEGGREECLGNGNV